MFINIHVVNIQFFTTVKKFRGQILIIEWM